MTDGQMVLFQEWQYDIDNGGVLARCPQCGKRMVMNYYATHNPYQYCPYCGIALEEGNYKRAADLRDEPRKGEA